MGTVCIRQFHCYGYHLFGIEKCKRLKKTQFQSNGEKQMIFYAILTCKAYSHGDELNPTNIIGKKDLSDANNCNFFPQLIIN